MGEKPWRPSETSVSQFVPVCPSVTQQKKTLASLRTKNRPQNGKQLVKLRFLLIFGGDDARLITRNNVHFLLPWLKKEAGGAAGPVEPVDLGLLVLLDR